MPEISIIIPSYNAQSFVDKCVESISNQTFSDFEVIVIDDGSTDNSLKQWKKYEKKDSRFRVFHQENQGQAVSRNRAIKESCGKYITFVDVDDFIDSKMLETMYQAIKTQKADLVWCELYKVEKEKKEPLLPIFEKIIDEKKDYILNNAGPVAKLIKKEILLENELYFLENRIYEDIAIVPSYALYAKKIVHIRKPMYYYMIYEGSTMHQVTYNKKLEDIFFAMEHMKNAFGTKNQEEIEYLHIHHLLHAASLRFFQFPEGKQNLSKIVNIIKKTYPNWKQNPYYKRRGMKFKMICYFFYKKQYWLLKLLLK